LEEAHRAWVDACTRGMVMGLTWEREGEGEGEEEGAGTCGVRRANWNTHGPGSRAADSRQKTADGDARRFAVP
jgi:hypothetical protein